MKINQSIHEARTHGGGDSNNNSKKKTNFIKFWFSTPTDGNNDRHYVPALDGLRTFAVILVIINHLSFRIAPGGHVGVDIFFVLSGFLITGVLVREWNKTGRISVLAFYARRALRLMPALVLVVSCDLAFELIVGGPDINQLGSSFAAVFYVMDFVRAFSRYSELSTVGHTWSLAVEEHFYLIWPLLLGPIMTFAPRSRILAILVLSGLVALWRIYMVFGGSTFDRIYYAFDARSDQILAGCALALWLSTNPRTRLTRWIGQLWPLSIAGILAITIWGEGPGYVALSVFPVIVAVFACVLIINLKQEESILSNIASNKIVVIFGKLSYGIYLWHWTFLINARYYTDNRIIGFLAIVLSIVVAMISYKFVEVPMLKKKRQFELDSGKFFYSNSLSLIHKSAEYPAGEGGVTMGGATVLIEDVLSVSSKTS